MVGNQYLRISMKEVNGVKEGIHPNYQEATVKCHCGNEFKVGSTMKEIRVEVCSKCHPFYTGTQKAVAARGRIDKFNRKYAWQHGTRIREQITGWSMTSAGYL